MKEILFSWDNNDGIDCMNGMWLFWWYNGSGGAAELLWILLIYDNGGGASLVGIGTKLLLKLFPIWLSDQQRFFILKIENLDLSRF